MNGRRESNRPRAERQATINRREGVRSRYQRCPKCKKLRLKMIPANMDWGNRTQWQPIEPGGKKVCHICVQRSRAGGST